MQIFNKQVVHERPDIEAKKVQLLLQMAEDKKQLASLEAKILLMLSESEGNILDDELLINTLSESKLTALAISERVAEAEVTEREINSARAKYSEVATRGSLIYFVIADLATIDPMYQYSLAYYANLFNRCLADSEKSADLETRLENILTYSTLTIYQNICRGLFEKDKLLFSACICFQILRHTSEIHDEEWNLFVRGAGALDKAAQPVNPLPEKIPGPIWDLLYAYEKNLQFRKKEDLEVEMANEDAKKKGAAAASGAGAGASGSPRGQDSQKKRRASQTNNTLASQLHPFSAVAPMNGLCESMKTAYVGWMVWAGEVDPLAHPMPLQFGESVNLFQRLLLVKALREDRLQFCISGFVGRKLGRKFAESPNSSMEEIYKDLDNAVSYTASRHYNCNNSLITITKYCMSMPADSMYFRVVARGGSHGDVASLCAEERFR